MQGKLKEMFHYNPDTGVFTWKKPPDKLPYLKGKKAGYILPSGYRAIKIDGKQYTAHRLAWIYVHGKAPAMIDHINRDSLDNRIVNLRPADYTINNQNHSRITNGSGLPVGVRMNKHRYAARITAHGVVYYLGGFNTAEEASNAYQKARRELHASRF